MRLPTLLLAAALCACGREPSPRPAAPAIQQQVDEIHRQQAADPAQPGAAGTDPLMEETCKDVSRSDASALEARMQQQRDAGEMVVLTGDEPTLLSCSRYWAKLEK